jgi:TRAP-type C4-dicarboxylate transport system permease small subunit
MRRAYDWLCRTESVVAAVCLVLMVLLIFAGGLARLMAQPLNWTTDIATCLFAWACFLCADIAWRRGELMSIQLATERLSAGAQRLVTQLNYAILSGFLIYLIYAGARLAWTSRARSFQGLADVSYSWVTASLPVGAALLLLTTLLKWRELLRGRTMGAVKENGPC